MPKRKFVTVVCAWIIADEEPARKKVSMGQTMAKKKKLGLTENLMKELALEDQDNYRRWLRMDVNAFQFLLEQIAPVISKRDTNLRQAIPADTKLADTTFGDLCKNLSKFQSTL